VNLRLRDVLRRVLVIFGFAVAFAMVILLVYPKYGLAFSLLIMLVLMVFLVRAYAMGYRYRCASCGHVFKVPLLVDFLTFSGMGRNRDGTYHTWKSLTCPSCGQRTRAVVVRADADPGTDADGSSASPGGGSSPAATDKGRAPQRRGGRKRR
jgi:predicted RNA-binding Zn-ribbon protein involved in translation (DUF1610 family)